MASGSGGYVKKSSRSWVLPSLKPFKCTNPDCTKSFLNQNGLKYHRAYGTCLKKTTPNAQSSDRPYYCYDEDCAKAYKNMNGLRYHYLHSAEHGERGMDMLNEGTHPAFLDRRAGSSSFASSSANGVLAVGDYEGSLPSTSSSSIHGQRNGHSHYPRNNFISSYQEESSTSGGTTPSTNYEEYEQPSYIPSQPMDIRGAQQSPSAVSRDLLDAVNLFSDDPHSNEPRSSTQTFHEYSQYQAASVPGDWSGQPSSAFYDVSNILLPYMNGSYYSVSQPPQFNSAFAPPPMTFGARTHRFHPYSTSARSYIPTAMQSPPKSMQSPPRPRRLSL